MSLLMVNESVMKWISYSLSVCLFIYLPIYLFIYLPSEINIYNNIPSILLRKPSNSIPISLLILEIIKTA